MQPIEDGSKRIVEAASGILSIDDVTEGVSPANSIRIRGRLLVPSDEAYRLLDERFRPLGHTPMLRREEKGTRDEVLALPMRFNTAKQQPWLALGLFALTVVSCLYVGALMSSTDATAAIRLADGLPFAATLLGILVTHEFGHYLAAQRLGSPTSLPYFLPLPMPPFGTLGAFIRMTQPPRNRRHLMIVGAAGPVAGLVVALPLLWLGLRLSEVSPVPPGSYMLEGNSLLYAGMKFLAFGQFLPANGLDVFVHPVAFAAWGGLLVTALNLIPAGQLDGGHIVFALFGARRAKWIRYGVLAVLAGLSFLWIGWLLWLGLVMLFGRFQDMPLDEITDITPQQRVFGVVMLIVFVLVFVPVPLTIIP